jgi:hypothetical protein
MGTRSTSAAEMEAAEQSIDEPIRCVVFEGNVSRREITAQDWASVGIDRRTDVWDRANNFRIPVDEFDKAALRILAEQPGMRIE